MGACATKCKVSMWASWSQCTKTCGGGVRTRKRSQEGGALGSCPSLSETQACNTTPCAQAKNCAVGQWAQWSACSLPCGGGRSERSRPITVQPSTDGQQCPMLTESRQCNTQGCPTPTDCKVSPWGDFDKCTKSCGGGMQKRVRTVIEAATNGGSCPQLAEQRKCNTQGCADEVASAVAKEQNAEG